MHWCSGTACCPVEAEVRDRHPYAPLVIAEWTGVWFPARSHKPLDVGSNPTSATDGRVRKPAKRPGRGPGDSAGSTPASATRGDGPRRSAVKTGAAAAPIVARRLPTARPRDWSRRLTARRQTHILATVVRPHPGPLGSAGGGNGAPPVRSASVSAARLRGREEGRVQLPGGPLKEEMGTHVPRSGETALQAVCGGFDSHRLQTIKGLGLLRGLRRFGRCRVRHGQCFLPSPRYSGERGRG